MFGQVEPDKVRGREVNCGRTQWEEESRAISWPFKPDNAREGKISKQHCVVKLILIKWGWD